LRAGSKEGEAGDELEGVEAATHRIFGRDAAGELVADGGGDFFVAGVGAGGGGSTEAFELREEIPDPMGWFFRPRISARAMA
jgi:hypothetical protein